MLNVKAVSEGGTFVASGGSPFGYVCTLKVSPVFWLLANLVTSPAPSQSRWRGHDRRQRGPVDTGHVRFAAKIGRHRKVRILHGRSVDIRNAVRNCTYGSLTFDVLVTVNP